LKNLSNILTINPRKEWNGLEDKIVLEIVGNVAENKTLESLHLDLSL